MKMLVLLIAMVMATSVKAENLVIDTWWDVDYAKNACELSQDKQHLAVCQNAQTTQVRSFESQLITELAANPNCKGVSVSTVFTKAANSAMEEGSYWSFNVNFWKDSKKQSWQLSKGKTSKYFEGTGTPKDIAEKLCVILKGTGAST